MRIATLLEPAAADEDRLCVRRHGDRVIVIVADGAGGTGGGAQAAQQVCDALGGFDGEDVDWVAALEAVDAGIAASSSAGWSTAVVAEIRGGQVRGASVGDSGGFVIDGDELRELTEEQRRKPLVGSGEARPVAFGPVPVGAVLLVASDGLVKYIDRAGLRAAMEMAPPEGVAALLRAVRLPGGGLQDDVAIVLAAGIAPAESTAPRVGESTTR